MPTFNFQCPGCKSVLKSAGPVEAGKKIKCPKCTTVFQYAATPTARATVQDREPGEETRVRRRRDDDYDDEPPRKRRSRYEEEDEGRDDYEEDRPRRRRRRKQSASPSLALWLVLGGVGLVVLVGGGLALVWLLGGFTQSRIVGRWTVDHPIAQGALTYDFRSDGSFTLTSNWVGNFELSGTYSVSGNTLTLMPNNVQGQGRNFPAGQVGQMQVQIESVSATQLILSGAGPLGQQQRTVLKRIP
jgi:hypothetical protein